MTIKVAGKSKQRPEKTNTLVNPVKTLTNLNLEKLMLRLTLAQIIADC